MLCNLTNKLEMARSLYRNPGQVLSEQNGTISQRYCSGGSTIIHRYRQVVREGDIYPGYGSESGCARGASHVGPDLKGLSAGLAMISGVGVRRTAEEISHLIVVREKALGLPG
jgi:hypothetical protein